MLRMDLQDGFQEASYGWRKGLQSHEILVLCGVLAVAGLG